MNRGLNNFIMFTTGVVLGTLAASRYFKEKYEKISQEEIESVKEVYKKKEEELKTLNKGVEERNKIVVEEHNKIADKYVKLANQYNKGVSTVRDQIGPYVITPEEFDEEGYETISLTYYADGVLTDEQDFPIEDIEDTADLFTEEIAVEEEADTNLSKNEDSNDDTVTNE